MRFACPADSLEVCKRSATSVNENMDPWAFESLRPSDLVFVALGPELAVLAGSRKNESPESPTSTPEGPKWAPDGAAPGEAPGHFGRYFWKTALGA